ncbi:hypothetical protein, partial [Kurthia zopfii]|uniref:hypothetical protein n=1 Tax=Kurthia zopfii TaxID=1650 RepID=UPI001C99301E
ERAFGTRHQNPRRKLDHANPEKKAYHSKLETTLISRRKPFTNLETTLTLAFSTTLKKLKTGLLNE